MLKRKLSGLFLRKYWPFLLVLSVGLMAGSYFLVSSIREEFTDPLPEVAEITSIHARVKAYPDRFEFDVPAKFWPQVINALGPASVDHNAAKWLSMGQLEIGVRGRQSVKLDIYNLSSHSDDSGAFSDNSVPKRRVYYRGGNSERLLRALKAAHAESIPKE